MSANTRRMIGDAIRGIKRSDETKSKLSVALGGKNNPMYGKRHSVVTRKLLSIAGRNRRHTEETKLKISKALFKGENTEYGSEFNALLKRKIRERDNHTCKHCGIDQLVCRRKLHIHHINYNKKDNRLDNLISLCTSCHSITNANRKYWMQYFRRIIKSMHGVSL